MKKENNVLSSDFLDYQIFVVPNEEKSVKINYLSNQARLLVVLPKDDPNEEFLMKILTAAKFDTSKEVALLYVTKKLSTRFNSLELKESIKNILFFGVNPKKIGLNIQDQLYFPIELNSFWMLSAHSLTEISEQKELKSALWNCLKRKFVDNLE